MEKEVLLRVGGEKKKLNWVDRKGDYEGHYELNGENFDGHRVLWSFSYEPQTYLKESELSGDEWRKGGVIKYFKDGIQVYEQFCREPDYAPRKILETLPKLMEFDWDKLKEGTKIYYRDTPATVKYPILEQGSVIIEVDGAERFPDHAWADEDWQKLEDPKSVKDDIFSPFIWWYRK